MEYLNALIGNTEMYIPVNEKLGSSMLLAHKCLNYKKHIARMRHAYKGTIESERVEASADFFYVLEDVLDEQGYPDVIHHLFDMFSTDERKLLYALFREDKTVRFLVAVQGYEEEMIQRTVRLFFERLKQKNFLRRKIMRQFETKLTLRIYDTKLIEKMNMIMKFNPNRYQSKNQLLLELLELGVREKLKEFPTPPTTPAAAANAIPVSHECNCNAETLKQIKELIEEMHLYNKQNVEGLLAHLKMSERLSSSIYNMVFAILKDEPVTPVQIELGYLDDVPKRFAEFLAMLLDELIKEEKDEDDESTETEEDEDRLVS